MSERVEESGASATVVIQVDFAVFAPPESDHTSVLRAVVADLGFQRFRELVGLHQGRVRPTIDLLRANAHRVKNLYAAQRTRPYETHDVRVVVDFPHVELPRPLGTSSPKAQVRKLFTEAVGTLGAPETRLREKGGDKFVVSGPGPTRPDGARWGTVWDGVVREWSASVTLADGSADVPAPALVGALARQGMAHPRASSQNPGVWKVTGAVTGGAEAARLSFEGALTAIGVPDSDYALGTPRPAALPASATGTPGVGSALMSQRPRSGLRFASTAAPGSSEISPARSRSPRQDAPGRPETVTPPRAARTPR